MESGSSEQKGQVLRQRIPNRDKRRILGKWPSHASDLKAIPSEKLLLGFPVHNINVGEVGNIDPVRIYLG